MDLTPRRPDLFRYVAAHSFELLEPLVALDLLEVRTLLRAFVEDAGDYFSQWFGEVLRVLAFAVDDFVVGDILVFGLEGSVT